MLRRKPEPATILVTVTLPDRVITFERLVPNKHNYKDFMDKTRVRYPDATKLRFELKK